MKKPEIRQFSLIHLKKNQRGVMAGVFVLSAGLVFMLVWFTGGIRYAYSHAMYIPIVLAGLTIGKHWGVAIAVLGGVLLGPLMPFETATTPYVQQDVLNWVFRLSLFIILGFTSGNISDELRKKNQTIANMFSMHPETQIPNANYLSVIFEEDTKPTHYFVASLLINNYENIIDLLGTDIYHKILRKTYLRLRNIGSENIVIQADKNKFWFIQSNVEVRKNIEVLLATLKEPLQVDKIPVYTEFAIGADILWHKIHLRDLNSFKQADMSARYAQRNSINYVVFDEKKMSLMNDFELLGIFPHALDNNETYLAFQPKFNLVTDEIMGLEALIRWEHPEQGLIMPGRIIPLVESTQLIHKLTDWVIDHAIAKLEELEEQGLKQTISINLSVKNLLEPNFITKLISSIKKSTISPERLEFEITESVLIVNLEETKAVLQKLSDLGFLISIDDFGKGHSSLSYLMQFKFHTIKLDQQFMKHIQSDVSVPFILQATIDLAHKLGVKILAEGVENKETAQLIKELGADYVQGFYYAKPIHQDEIIPYLQKHKK